MRTAVSLAYLNEQNDAQYVFYKETPKPIRNLRIPDFQAEDILILGSYNAICPTLRKQVRLLTSAAQQAESIVYYDINFRKSHLPEAEALTPAIHENFAVADIVRGSADDFEILYGCRDAETIYKERIAPFYCGFYLYPCRQRPESVSATTDAVLCRAVNKCGQHHRSRR